MGCVSLGYLKRWESQYKQSCKTSRKDFFVCNETGFLASLAMWHILYRFFELEPNCCVILARYVCLLVGFFLLLFRDSPQAIDSPEIPHQFIRINQQVHFPSLT
jgi:hypothetical protein